MAAPSSAPPQKTRPNEAWRTILDEAFWPFACSTSFSKFPNSCAAHRQLLLYLKIWGKLEPSKKGPEVSTEVSKVHISYRMSSTNMLDLNSKTSDPTDLECPRLEIVVHGSSSHQHPSLHRDPDRPRHHMKRLLPNVIPLFIPSQVKH